MKNIILIGMPGSGKTIVGKLLAKTSSREFFDSDAEYEKKFGISIKDTFEFLGEEVFRERESEIIKNLAQKNNAVISLGGGAVLKKENMSVLKNNGISIYLYAEPEILHNRIKNSERPLKNNISLLYENRKILYNEYGDFTIDTSQLSPEEVCEKIRRIL